MCNSLILTLFYRVSLVSVQFCPNLNLAEKICSLHCWKKINFTTKCCIHISTILQYFITNTPGWSVFALNKKSQTLVEKILVQYITIACLPENQDFERITAANII